MDSTGGLVSVVIPTYNRRQSLAKIINPLLEDASTGEVVLVVDGSHDGTFEFLNEWAKNETRIHPIFQDNSGPAAARQRGIDAARYDIVVLLDDDVEASAGLVTAHARWHRDNDRRLVIGYMPTNVPVPRRPGQVATVLYSQDYEEVCREYETDSRTVFTFLWEGNISLRRSTLREVGYASSEELRYHEDMRFGFRCQEAGLEAVFDRTLLAAHSHSRNLRRFAADSRRSGQGKAELIREYPEFSNDIDPLAVLSSRERRIVRVLASAWGRPIAMPMLIMAAYVFGRVHAWKLEVFSARALRQVEILYGFNRTDGATKAK